MKPLLARLLPLKAAHLLQVVNLWKPNDTMKIEMCTMTCANVEFIVQRKVVELASRYVEQSCQWKGILSIVMGQLPLENSNPLFILVEKGWMLVGKRGSCTNK